MAKAMVGALRATMSLDSAQFVRGSKKAQGSMGRLARTAAKVAKAMTAVFTAAFAAISAGLKSVANDADLIAKTSQRLGIASDALVELRYTAGLAGVGFDRLKTSILRLTQSMSDVAKGGTTDAVRAFKAMGIEVLNANGTMKTQTAVLSEIAEKFKNYKDGAEKTALAIAIFGRAGAEMIPLLNQGAEAIAKSNQEARDFGLTMSERLQKSSEQFNDNMSRMGSLMRGIFVVLAEKLNPRLSALTDRIIAWSKESKAAQRIGSVLADIFVNIAQGAVVLYAAISLVIEGLSVLGRSAQAIYNGDFKKLPGIFVESKDKIVDTINSAKEYIKLLGSAPLTIQKNKKDDRPAAPTLTKPVKAAGGGKKGGKSEGDKLRDLIRTADVYIQKQNMMRQALGQTDLQAAQSKHTQELMNKALRANITLDDQVIQKLKEKGAEMGRVQAATEKAKEAYDFTRGALKGFISDLRTGLQEGKGFFKSFADAATNLLDKVINRIEDQFVEALMKMKFGFNDLKGSMGGFGGILSGLFNSFSGIARFIGGLFKNLLPGFANGGSFKVGGAGGIDSQMVAFRASPNETVSVTKPGQVPQGAGGGGGTTVNVYAPEGSKVERRQRTGPQGQPIEDIILKAITNKIGRGGLDDPMLSRYQMRPAPVRR